MSLNNFLMMGHRASAKAVCVVLLVSMADSRTERLCELPTPSNSRHCITCMYLITIVEGLTEHFVASVVFT